MWFVHVDAAGVLQDRDNDPPGRSQNDGNQRLCCYRRAWSQLAHGGAKKPGSNQQKRLEQLSQTSSPQKSRVTKTLSWLFL
mmetsp:Transcript_20121/g.42029  ORF Transcript_20121/g.42029 Transcript_20121/m.42029 type:complete len:81 (+) Transcript_20121:3245-3487(+)